MNKIETSLVNQILGRVQGIEMKLNAQISALNARVEKVEPQSIAPPPELPYEVKGLINSISPVHTPEVSSGPGKALLNFAGPITRSLTPAEVLAQAVFDHKKNKKET